MNLTTRIHFRTPGLAVPAVLLTLALPLLTSSCDTESVVAPANPVSQEDSTAENVFEIHLQGSFVNTPLKVDLDSAMIFRGNVTTGSILAFAGILPVRLENGRHSVAVTMNYATTDTAFTLTDTLYVGVRVSSTLAIEFVLQRAPFRYL